MLNPNVKSGVVYLRTGYLSLWSARYNRPCGVNRSNNRTVDLEARAGAVKSDVTFFICVNKPEISAAITLMITAVNTSTESKVKICCASV